MGTLKFLLITWLKRSSKTAQKVGGFTLLELLVGLVLAFLIITPLLGFVINIMNTDRQEQAKTNSEQEIQSAMEYISRDLQQAVYIYDNKALENNHSTDADSGIRDQLPDLGANGEPVLVFWKRKLIENALPTQGLTANDCLNPQLNAQCNDTYVYSLVGYYLIKGNTTAANLPWSRTARIGRFEIQDGVPDPQDPDNPPIRPADDGFASFSLSKTGSIAQSMNQWQKDGNFTPDKLPQNNILIDYIDQTPTTVDADPVPFEACPPEPVATDGEPEWKQVPPTSETFSFYACVWSAKNTARVYIRGNALARISPSNNPPTYTAAQSSFFPKARIEVKSRASLGTGG
jgi:type II secretory pathway pseudopilin PulG